MKKTFESECSRCGDRFKIEIDGSNPAAFQVLALIAIGSEGKGLEDGTKLLD